jgi:hypothetical protein
MSEPSPCPDCGVTLAPHDGPTHPYLGASAACWALFNEVLAREYASPVLMERVHRLTVDAYAAQHPGQPERRTIQSVWGHLAALHMTLERKLDPVFARRVIAALVDSGDGLVWLAPPPSLGAITVVEVAAAPDEAAHAAAVDRWAESVWVAWSPHHAAVRAIADRIAAKL